MRLPVLWLMAGFAAGILLGSAAGVMPGVWIGIALAAIVAGFACVRRQWLLPAWALSLLAWAALGALAGTLERAAIPANHVSRLVWGGQLDTSEPLRWRGRLRSDPVRLSWGFRSEIDLDEVEVGGQPLKISGGLRLSHFRREIQGESMPALSAGDRVEALVRARPPRNFLTPGSFDARTQLARQGVHLTGSLRALELLTKLGGVPPTLAQRLARLRGYLLARVDALFGAAPDQAAVLRAMLLGDYNFLDRDVSLSFQRTSVYHILVVSGLHVAALAAFVWWVAHRLRFSLLLTVVIIFVVLGFFVAVVEDRPPIERAALMAVIVLLARLMFRRVHILNTLAVAALLVLVIRPSSLADPSFQLSFLAAAIIGGIALPLVAVTSAPFRQALEHLSDVTRDAAHSPRAIQFRLDLRSLAEWLAWRLPAQVAPRAAALLVVPFALTFRVWEILLISFSVQFAMAPLMAQFFHRVSLSGPLANMPAAVLSGLIVPFGFIALGLDALGRWFAVPAVWITGCLTQALLGIVQSMSAWPRGAYRIPGPPSWVLASFYTLLALTSVAATSRRKRWAIVLALPLGALVLVTVTYPFAPKLAAGSLEIAVLDVGQGDAIFVAFPDGRTLLTDGGGSYGISRVAGMRTGLDIGETVVSPYLWQRGISRLDAVVLSHAHTDHLDGLNAVLDNFRVSELWIGRAVDSPAFRALVELAQARGVRVIDRTRGESFSWGGVTGLVLWPEDPSTASEASNNDSLVLRLEHGGEAFLLPGDIERPVEADLVTRDDPLAAGVLKVPHHGSRTSTSEVFLRAAQPRVAALSVGENNPFGHPHREALDRLRAAGVRLLRTDQDGTVTFSSDGRTVRTTSFVAGSQR